MNCKALFFILFFSMLGITLASAPAQAQDSTRYKSGYGDIPEFGGPDGPARSVKDADEDKQSVYTFSILQRALAPYFDFKKRANDNHGISFGFQYYLLPQINNESDADNAAGGIFRFAGSWTLLGRGGGNTGRIEWRVEHRSNVFGAQSPNDLSGELGMRALNSGFGYSGAFDLDLAVINWTQGFNNNTAGIALGRLAFDVYLDAFPFQTFSRGFFNRAFLLNPTMGTTGIGALGAVAKGYITKQIWIGGQIYDANAASGSFDIDTFKEGEFLKAVEIGWSPDISSRKKRVVQVTYWHKDAREEAGTSKGSGVAFSAAYQFNSKLFPFIRVGHSDGGAGVAAETSASVGVEITTRFDQFLSIGVGWAKLPESSTGSRPKDEFVLESSYKIQLSQNGSLTPDVQILFNPAGNPEADVIVVGGLRAIWML